MSRYTQVCGICPDKHWIDPESDGQRHDAGPHGATLDAHHAPMPVGLHDPVIQRRMLANALRIVHARVPAATRLSLATSDQDRYGFTLTSVQDAEGRELLPAWDNPGHPLAGLYDEVIDEISDLDWDGVVGEGSGGYVTLAVPSGRVVHSA